MSTIITYYTTGSNQDENNNEGKRDSQEMVQNILHEITNYEENYHFDDIQSGVERNQPVPRSFQNHSSPNQNMYLNNRRSLTVFNSHAQRAPTGVHSYPFPEFSEYPSSILAGASISGNVTINIGQRKRSHDEMSTTNESWRFLHVCRHVDFRIIQRIGIYDKSPDKP